MTRFSKYILNKFQKSTYQEFHNFLKSYKCVEVKLSQWGDMTIKKYMVGEHEFTVFAINGDLKNIYLLG